MWPVQFAAYLRLETPTGPCLQPQVILSEVSYDFGEPAGAALAAGERAGEVCTGVVAGDDCAFAGAGELCDVG